MKEVRTVTDKEGKYCFDVKPGQYQIYPHLTSEEKESDLHLQPEFYDLEIKSKPRLDIDFYQSKVSISGSVICLEECSEDIEVVLISQRNEQETTSKLDEGKFVFENILSGQYKLLVKKENYCWTSDSQLIRVQNSPIQHITFNQSGFSVFYKSTHDMEVAWLNHRTDGRGKRQILKSENKICLPAKGKYTIEPRACFLFEKAQFEYDTENIETLSFKPTEFQINSKITVASSVADKIKKFSSDIEIFLDEVFEGTTYKYKTEKAKLSQQNSQFSFYSKPDANLIVTPTIPERLRNKPHFKNLIFYPKFKTISLENDCLLREEDLAFELRYGVIMEGTITPKLKDVNVSALIKDTDDNIAIALSRADGTYSIGPLYSEYNYSLIAKLPGYKIVQASTGSYDFVAEKLSFLEVKVVDKDNLPLEGAIVALSSSEKGFSVNSTTNKEGIANFSDLFKGEYSVKPVLKEYQLSPSQMQIVIEGGTHYKKQFTGKRVAYSAYGQSKGLISSVSSE